MKVKCDGRSSFKVVQPFRMLTNRVADVYLTFGFTQQME